MTTNITAEQARAKQRDTRLARFYERSSRAEDLAAPGVPGTLPPDNLVPVDQLDNGLDVEIAAWARPLAGDVLTLNCDGEAVFTFTLEDPVADAFPITTTLDPDLLKVDGAHVLDYQVKAGSGSISSSLPTTVLVEREPPNHNNIPSALVFPDEVVSGGLTADYLAANDDQVIATVPAYSGMEVGQSVRVYWNDSVLVGPVTLTRIDVIAQRVNVAISGDVVRSTGDGSKASHYVLTSRAGFDGQRSEEALVDVFLTPAPANLQAPVVPLAEDDLIDLADADAGVTIEVPAYDNARSIDLLSARWGTRVLSSVLVGVAEFPIEIPVSRSVLIGEGTGTVAVSYQVVRYGHGFSAPELSVEVDIDTVGPVDPDPGTPENEALVAPTVTSSTDKENELTPEDLGKEATVTVPFYEGAALGQIVTVYWGGLVAENAGEYTLTQSDLDDGTIPPFTVAADIAGDTPNNPAFPVYYTLSRPASETPANPVRSLAQAVNVHMSQPGGPDGLDPAEFPDVNEVGWLLTEQVIKGCNVLVKPYENMRAGDELSLSWQAYSTTNAAEGSEITGTEYTSSTVTVGVPELVNGVAFVVPYTEAIEPIAGASPSAQGSGKASYTVTQGGADYSPAVEALVPIDLGAP